MKWCADLFSRRSTGPFSLPSCRRHAVAAAAKIPEDGHDLSARLALKLFYRSTASFLTPSAEKLSGTVFEAVISLLQQCFNNEPDFEGDIFEDIDADEQFKRWRLVKRAMQLVLNFQQKYPSTIAAYMPKICATVIAAVQRPRGTFSDHCDFSLL